jgi:hypothetical protein
MDGDDTITGPEEEVDGVRTAPLDHRARMSS